jgi:hypothetical protein
MFDEPANQPALERRALAIVCFYALGTPAANGPVDDCTNLRVPLGFCVLGALDDLVAVASDVP